MALIPGWERLCNESKMERQNCWGTKGRGLPVDTSQTTVESEVGTGWSCHVKGDAERSLQIAINSASMVCAVARAGMSITVTWVDRGGT